MRCPFCGDAGSQVKDSRPAEEGAAIRRRRECPACEARFTTFERVQLRELTVVKRDARRVPFERDKLARSIRLALRKRPVEADDVDRMISAIVRDLESRGEADVPSEAIGEAVMAALEEVDAVAYLRFASVYLDFTEPDDFEAFARRLAKGRA